MKKLFVIAFVLSLIGCPASPPDEEPVVKESPALTEPAPPGPGKSHLQVKNSTEVPTVVYVSFGADSAITADDWKLCEGSGLTCSFKLGPSGESQYDLDKYLNATIAFGGPVACGNTKAELNINNPKWYDVLDVSLVDGYSNKIKITANDTVLGPPAGKDGNEKILGVFPYGCDICTGRQNPPCGIAPGGTGCKAGTQYDPKPPCQWKGSVMGGGTNVVVELVP